MSNEKSSPFDDFERTCVGIATPGESEFAFLNRSASDEVVTIRNRVETLLSYYPVEGLENLRGRLRSGKDQNFHGALFELVLYKLLVNLGCEVELYDIDNDQRRPDFLIRHGDQSCYIEVTVVDPKLDTLELNHYEQDALNKLDSLGGCGFGIAVKIEGTLDRLLKKKDLTKPFRTLMEANRLDSVREMFAEHGHFGGPAEEIREEDWKLTGHLFPIDSERFVYRIDRAPIKIAPEKAILKRLEDKAKRYGELDAPFIIAINARELGFGSRDDGVDALYGIRSINMSFDYNTSPPSLVPSGVVRSSGGIWFTNDGRPRYNRVSGAMFFERLDPSKLAPPMTLYVNPNLDDPSIPNALYRLPHAIEENQELRFDEGECIQSLLSDAIV